MNERKVTMNKCIIAPSILSADIARLGEEVKAVLAAGADWVHVDVMDNHYVPNLTFGPLVVSALRQFGITAPLDVHLMTESVDELIVSFAKAGASSITIHPEATRHVHRSLQLIKDHACLAGLAFNPATSLTWLENLRDQLDLILIMSVNPGFGGQQFIPQSLSKIKAASKWIHDVSKPIYLAVDGGVNAKNAASIIEAGAEVLIAGSAIFCEADYKKAIQDLRI